MLTLKAIRKASNFMKQALGLPGICIAFIGAAFTGGAATLVTFDDLSPGPVGNFVVIQNGYEGLQWSGFGVLDGSLLPPADGYHAGVVSPNNVAFNFDQYHRTSIISSVSAFNLDSADLTA